MASSKRRRVSSVRCPTWTGQSPRGDEREFDVCGAQDEARTEGGLSGLEEARLAIRSGDKMRYEANAGAEAGLIEIGTGWQERGCCQRDAVSAW